MAFWLWCSGWCVLLGIWLYAVTPAHAVHGAHLMFIGGFSLMIFMIASRLTLSHGGFDLIFESRSPAYGWIGGLLIIAALSRTIAGWVAPSDFWRWILASSLIFLSALGLWISVFLGRILRIQKERNSGYGRT